MDLCMCERVPQGRGGCQCGLPRVSTPTVLTFERRGSVCVLESMYLTGYTDGVLCGTTYTSGSGVTESLLRIDEYMKICL